MLEFSPDNLPTLIVETADQLKSFAKLVADWGKKINLVADPEEQSIFDQHIQDCILAFTALKTSCSRACELPLVDIGSGAGFPGIVWKILNPQQPAFLIEPRGKRATFLNTVVSRLKLQSTFVIESRFEDVSRETLPSACLFTSRAVAYDVDLTNRIVEDVRNNGSIWAVMSGPESLAKLKNSIQMMVLEGTHETPIEVQSSEYELAEGLGKRSVFYVARA